MMVTGWLPPVGSDMVAAPYSSGSAHATPLVTRACPSAVSDISLPGWSASVAGGTIQRSAPALRMNITFFCMSPRNVPAC